MTAIAAIVHRKHIYMAADSAVTWGNGMRVNCRPPKAWRVGEYVIGVAGDAAYDRAFVAASWDTTIDRMPERIEAQLAKYDMKPSEGEALIGYRGRIYYYDDRSLFATRDPFGVAGCASAHLLGYLDATRGMDPLPRLRGAIRSAAKYCDSCSLPMVIVSTV